MSDGHWNRRSRCQEWTVAETGTTGARKVVNFSLTRADGSSGLVSNPRLTKVSTRIYGVRRGVYVRRRTEVQTQIRQYDGGDDAAVVDLSLRAWAPVFHSLETVLGDTIFDRLHPHWQSDQQRAVEEVLAAEAIKVWVAHVGERIAGFVAVELHRERSIGEVYMLAVDPAFQNDGIGTQLTVSALDWIKDAGMTVAMVESGGDAGHAPARRTYEKAGFSLLPVARYFKAL